MSTIFFRFSMYVFVFVSRFDVSVALLFVKGVFGEVPTFPSQESLKRATVLVKPAFFGFYLIFVCSLSCI